MVMSVRMKRKEARDMEMEAKNTEKSEKKKTPKISEWGNID